MRMGEEIAERTHQDENDPSFRACNLHYKVMNKEKRASLVSSIRQFLAVTKESELAIARTKDKSNVWL